jgi:hypothetical protein
MVFVAALAVAGAGWWLFGWTTIDNPSLGLLREQRHWGRVTEIHGDSNRDGRVDTILFGTWENPLDTPHFQWRESWEDRDFDGVWDTWIVNTNPGTQVKFDLDGDGEPDWSLRMQQDDEFYSRILEIRDR